MTNEVTMNGIQATKACNVFLIFVEQVQWVIALESTYSMLFTVKLFFV